MRSLLQRLIQVQQPVPTSTPHDLVIAYPFPLAGTANHFASHHVQFDIASESIGPGHEPCIQNSTASLQPKRARKIARNAPKAAPILLMWFATSILFRRHQANKERCSAAWPARTSASPRLALWAIFFGHSVAERRHSKNCDPLGKRSTLDDTLHCFFCRALGR